MNLPRAMANISKNLALAAAALALAATLGPVGTASAQGTINVNPISVGDEDYNALSSLKLGLQDCLDDAVVIFELDNLPSDQSTLDIYIGNNCNQTDRNDEQGANCKFVTTVAIEDSSNDFEVEIKASDLDCTEGQTQEPTLWFLAVDQSQGNDDPGTGYASFKIEIDTKAPDAPTELQGGSGESQIPLKWDTSDSDIESFVVYIDSSPIDGDAGTGCGSSVLNPGGAPPSSGVTERKINEATATGTNLKSSDIDGDRAAVAIVAIDEAGNRSPLSGVACVDVVPTTGFWEDYQGRPDAVDAGCPCAALGPIHVETAWPVALALTVLGLRRRRHRGPVRGTDRHDGGRS